MRTTLKIPARLRSRAVMAALVAALTIPFAGCVDTIGIGTSRDLEIMWPRNGATLYGYEVLRARVRGYDLDDYEIYWYIDGGVERRMRNEWYESPRHKYYPVDTYDWYWRGRGPYEIGFIAEDWRGRRIAHRTVRVYVD
jgi:hypothetical protein